VLGIVNLAELAAAGMIDWVARVGEGLGLVEAGVPSYAGFRFPAEIISHGVGIVNLFGPASGGDHPVRLRRGWSGLLGWFRRPWSAR
jgi:hypothetical protein